MSSLAVSVPTHEYRRRSLSGDADFHFKRKKFSERNGVVYRTISRPPCRRTMIVQLGAIGLAMYVVSVYINFNIGQLTPKAISSEENLDLCSLTARSAHIYNDLKMTVTTGSLGALSPFRSNDYLWQQHLLNSIERKTFKMPFRNNSYPTAGDLRNLVRKHKNGEATESEIINKYPYQYLLTPTESCDLVINSELSVYLLFIIKSTLTHFKRRNAIRNTWANSTYTDGYIIRRIFLVGQNYSVDWDIQQESKKYGDILQIDFLDNYRNNTWKTRGGFKWAAEHCSGAKYAMLVDDDYYVATDYVIQLLELAGKQENMYMGWVNKRPSPFRSKGTKWYISTEEYPYPFYPPFVSAGAVLMSMDFVVNVNIASLYTKHFAIDDVFLAIVSNKLQIAPQSNRLFFSGQIPYIGSLFESTLACHGYESPLELYNAWVTHLLIKCYGRNIVNHFLMKLNDKRTKPSIQL